MKWPDLLALAWNNLKQRKSRTILTMIAVAIGTASIVVMVSIGAGISAQQEQWLQNIGDFRKIEVYQSGDTVIDDKIVEQIKAMDHVSALSPRMSVYYDNGSLTLSAGANDRYVRDWIEISAMDLSMLEALGIEIAEESSLKAKPGEIPVYVGDTAVYSFRDTLAPEGKNYRRQAIEGGGFEVYPDGTMKEIEDQEAEEPFFDSANTPLTLKATTYEGTELMTKKLVPKGRLKGNFNNYETVDGIIMSIDDALGLLKDLNKAAGNPAPKVQYNSITLLADDVKNVSDLEKQISNLGFYTSSAQSMREQAQESSRQIQLMLGGIGAISLLVAAIGISNTMVMTIQERTKELGIMKALGCKTSDIQLMVLLEAAIIGFLGGLAGLIVSEIISMVINFITIQPPITDFAGFWQMITTPSLQMSHISFGLALSAMLFSIAIGLVSGYAPARKAMKIPALEAIRHN